MKTTGARNAIAATIRRLWSAIEISSRRRRIEAGTVTPPGSGALEADRGAAHRVVP